MLVYIAMKSRFIIIIVLDDTFIPNVHYLLKQSHDMKLVLWVPEVFI